MTITFESLRSELQSLGLPESNAHRRTYWVSSRKLGLAKTIDGAIEIFLVGPKLLPQTATVRRHLEHAAWTVADSGERLDANRIILPPAPHFIASASLIAIELHCAGFGEKESNQEVFDLVEPIIEISLRKNTLAEEYVVGLVGELLCLEALLEAVRSRPERRMSVLDMWQGYTPWAGKNFIVP